VRLRAAIVLAVVAVVAVACGSQDDGPKLSEAAKLGKEVAVMRSCTGCHGRNGEGATGPPWVGLYNSTVQLADGSTVTADFAYLVESIRDPKAKQVAGWGKMPVDPISDADIAAIIAFIMELPAPVTSG